MTANVEDTGRQGQVIVVVMARTSAIWLAAVSIVVVADARTQ
jgi:hypothetical protein